MEDVRVFLFNKIEDRDDLDDRKVAKYLKVSTKQVQNLRDGKRDLTFRHLLVLSSLVDPENYNERIKEWVGKIDKYDCTRNAFEYAAIIRDVEFLDSHIAAHAHEKRTVIEKYVKVYSFISNYLKGNIDYQRIGVELDKLSNINDPTLKILVDIYSCIDLLQRREFSYVLTKASKIERDIKMMSKSQLFAQECYLYRISEVLAFAHLFSNNLEEARHYSAILLNANINKRVNSDALYVIGMTYLLSNEKLCLQYLKQSKEVANELGIPRFISYANFNYNFAKILLSKEVDPDAHESLIAFERFNRGEITYEEAEQKIKEFEDIDMINYFESKDDIYKKFCDFVANSNLFYASIITRDLVRLGEGTKFIESLTKNLKKSKEEKGEVIFEEDFISCFNVGSGCVRSVCA
ncbi:AimR family lysis-lysogeny pheromone receptor [Bacillus licheniformis]|uniref:AimR family lysis-lysogeny pheromone receptor n=1 Tax=Bacillus TaxID=1386 RepID=UPI001CD7C763|nr:MULTISPECIES: AimR family lysis-lysogeny pheromone receptor [Bacillus]MCA1184569.1 AimR family lysis-lysogeny pheromone receptor [Bacillus licheniformis]MCC2134083.1 AimR family lysis-lysogeny pheromone receptor [Bacillus licheniformis]MCC2146419.1 AimR family lysis-lysogeny pheromone receptor [Bacillus licheniformis]MCC2161952.1 AimR family lysis-lysogeny pheromone receptor [Bacillus licheniformis]MCC2187103.1 AimR family lysis-lysogeny pheromone receptor [Bacillus licheniformis]